MQPYSQDLRDRVLRALERNESPTKIARRLEVSRGWVYQVRDRWLKEGQPSSRRIGGYRRSCLTGAEASLRAWIKAEPGLTLSQICVRLEEEKGIRITIPGLWHRLNKLNLTLKRKRSRKL